MSLVAMIAYTLSLGSESCLTEKRNLYFNNIFPKNNSYLGQSPKGKVMCSAQPSRHLGLCFASVFNHIII